MSYETFDSTPFTPQLNENEIWIRASQDLPKLGIYFALYNGDHCLFQVHDGGFRIINYQGEKNDAPQLHLIKYLDELSPEYWKQKSRALKAHRDLLSSEKLKSLSEIDQLKKANEGLAEQNEQARRLLKEIHEKDLAVPEQDLYWRINGFLYPYGEVFE